MFHVLRYCCSLVALTAFNAMTLVLFWKLSEVYLPITLVCFCIALSLVPGEVGSMIPMTLLFWEWSLGYPCSDCFHVVGSFAR